MERLQKVLARAGVASRRDCETLITAGRVTVNGAVVTELGTKVEPDAAITVDGRAVAAPEIPVYIMLNKPSGYVSTTDDPQGRPTVLDLLHKTPSARLYPVGRLDFDSEGLLLLTNDGELTHHMTHPSFAMEKEYMAWVAGQPDAADIERLRAGIPLDGKLAAADTVELAPLQSGDETILRIVIHEGRKREIRRLCDAIGHSVRRLQRLRQGPLHLGDLASGASRPLTEREIAQLKKLAPAPLSAPSLVALAGRNNSAKRNRSADPRPSVRRPYANRP
jgi:pseudouridine synthase